MNHASATGIIPTVTPRKTAAHEWALDAVQSTAITLREVDEGTGPAGTSTLFDHDRCRRPGPRMANTNEPLIPLLGGQDHPDCAAIREVAVWRRRMGLWMGRLISGVFGSYLLHLAMRLLWQLTESAWHRCEERCHPNMASSGSPVPLTEAGTWIERHRREQSSRSMMPRLRRALREQQPTTGRRSKAPRRRP